MKKLIILSLFIFPVFAYEDVALFIDTCMINVEVQQDN